MSGLAETGVGKVIALPGTDPASLFTGAGV